MHTRSFLQSSTILRAGLMASLLVGGGLGCKKKLASQDASVTTAEGEPDIAFVEESHDFGTIASGDVVRHTFRFKNQGKGELELVKPQSS